MMDHHLKKIGQLERVTLGEMAHQELRNFLMAGKLAPNEKLSLRSVAEALGVSIMPVREAVSRLVAEGALSVMPNRAVKVPLMTKAKLTELMEVRLHIEGYAAARTAELHSEEQLDTIRDLDRKFRDSVRDCTPNVELALRLNKEFHFAVYDACGLPTLTSIIEGLWLKIGPVINIDLGAAERLSQGTAEKHHARLVEAVAARDANGARDALHGDIKSSTAYILATNYLSDELTT